jgi:hypothetical protein
MVKQRIKDQSHQCRAGDHYRLLQLLEAPEKNAGDQRDQGGRDVDDRPLKEMRDLFIVR